MGIFRATTLFPCTMSIPESRVATYINKCKKRSNLLLQGVWGQSGFFNWALRERNIQVRVHLKIVL